jgi:hypothetical protein
MKGTIIYTIGKYINLSSGTKHVLLDIEYSGDANLLELSWIRTSHEFNNNLTEHDFLEVEKILECGLEQDLARELKEFYKNTDIVFKSEYDWEELDK